MPNDNSRREFLQAMLVAGGAALLGRNTSLAAPKTGSTPLPTPDFYWGIGIENCWIAQTNPKKDGNRRLLDVFLQMQHYEKWKEDLDLLREVGVNCIRYSVPWYKAEPKPGVYDWSWIDKPVEHLVNKLKIIPIMDLIHYGTPTWMEDGVIDPRFSDAIAKYAGAMAAHFKGLVNHYSPHNEPELTCLFCGLVGRWPPYLKTVDSWAKIGVAVAKGMVLEMNAIRAAITDAVIVSVDPWFLGVVDQYLGSKDDSKFQEMHLASSCYPASLAYGKIGANHPLVPWFENYGIKEAELAWFFKHAKKPDILGYNYYPDIFAFGWGDSVEARKRDYTKNSTVPVEKGAPEAAALLTPGIKQAQAYFNLPIYLTETSAGISLEARIAYINALGNWAKEMRKEKLPLKGVNWWPLFDTIQWDYREKVDKPLTDFIYEGGWNNGLYRINAGPNGDLQRVPTPAVKAFHDMIRRDNA